MGKALKDWGTGPAGGFTAMAMREPRRVGLIDEKGSLTWGDLHRRSNALARALADAGRRRGRQRRGDVPQPPRLRRRLRRDRQARRRHPAAQHGLRRPAAGRRPRARGSAGRDPRPGVHRPAGRRPDRRAGARLGRRRVRRGLHRRPRHGVRRLRRRPAGASRAHRDPHLRHHRRPQGRTAQRGGPRCRGLAAVADAAALRLAHPHRRTAVPHLGVRPPGAGDAARLDRGPAPEVRRPRAPSRPSRTSAATRWW